MNSHDSNCERHSPAGYINLVSFDPLIHLSLMQLTSDTYFFTSARSLEILRDLARR